MLTGHVHESPFKPAGSWADRIGRTWVFNAGRQIGPVPAIVDIDLAGGTASWRSLMGSGSLSLAAERAPERTRVLTRRPRQYSGSGSRAEPRPGAGRLALRETAQHVGDHRQAGRIAVLLLQVGQVGGDEVQPLGQADGDELRDRRIAGEQRLAVGGVAQDARLGSPRRSRC